MRQVEQVCCHLKQKLVDNSQINLRQGGKLKAALAPEARNVWREEAGK